MLTVTKIRNTFDDLLVVNAARVSFGKCHDRFDPIKDAKLIHYLVKHDHWSPLAHPHGTVSLYFTKQDTLDRLVQREDIMAGLTMRKGEDDNLWHITGSLWALLKLSYFLPNYDLYWEIKQRCRVSTQAFTDRFEPPFKMGDAKTQIIQSFTGNDDTITFHIKAPVFVARQLVKHQQKLVWNEVSRRYVDTPPEFYDPLKMPATLQENSWLVSPDGWENLCGWRGKAANKKQGSSNEVVADIIPTDTYMGSLGNYTYLLSNGVAPEQARMVLPQTMITEWYWSGTKEAFHRVCELRMKPDAQLETAYIATQIHRYLTCR